VQDHILTTAGDVLTSLSHLARVNQHPHWYLHLLLGVRPLVAKWTQEMLSSFGLRDPNLV
jgi:hypothetical protein